MKSLERASSLVEAAKAANIAIPPDLSNYDKNEFRHWNFFVSIQLGRPLQNSDSHFKNAKTIASTEKSELKFANLADKLE